MTEKDATTAEIVQDHIGHRCGIIRRERRLHVLIDGIDEPGWRICIACAGMLKVKLDIELRHIQGLEALYGRTVSPHSCGIAHIPGQRFGFQRQRAHALLDALAAKLDGESEVRAIKYPLGQCPPLCPACIRAMIIDLKRAKRRPGVGP